EVERAAKLLRDVAVGKTIVKVDALEDTIVFTGGITNEHFVSELEGRKVADAQRYGKVFYLMLEGKGRHPVLHFGMTGMLQVKGQRAMRYRENGKSKTASDEEWPPRFMKFVVHLRGDSDEDETQVAFLDARRLGRIRLCQTPLTEPPISALGFDPILGMPSLEEFSKAVRKRSSPIKALLLDQSFSAGVGNWVADEILYHARVHPEERCNVLTEAQVQALHEKISYVCETAVSVNADDTKFPENWLFQHRWGKGKKEKHTLKLVRLSESSVKLSVLISLIQPDGKLATIKWITVGGRTSAYIAELQKLKRGIDSTAKVRSK
ncbi:uncharacterized protein BXZ73DRAFT_48770, partial [Epithele typhae]|uniref:uncharacterized protein n=1 Tax=Epithele typhae TaxID=378194 RepID=UPI0020083883